MKKKLKQFLATAFASAIALAAVAGSSPVTVKADTSTEQTAFLMFSDRDWAFGNWDSTLESATTTVSGDGTYTVTLNASDVGGDGSTAANGAQVFCVDVEGLGASVTDISAISVSDVTILADGQEVALDASKLLTGDIEENGNYRIEIYNEYGETLNDSPIDQLGLSFTDTLSVTFTLSGITYGEAQETAETSGETAEVSTEQTAFLMFSDRDWAFGNWDDALASATAIVSGDGTYTVTLNAAEVGGDGSTAANGAQVFCVDIEGLGASVTDLSAITVSDVTILADGQEVALDASKLVTGDIEENGNFRIEIYNEYGDTLNDSPIDQLGLSFADTLSVTFTLSGITYGASEASDEAADAAEVAAVDLDGTYNAYIGFQSPSYSFRNAWNDSGYGLGTDEFNQVTGWDNNAEVVIPGTLTDAVIAGNGTYTVSVSGLEFASTDFDGMDYMRLIFVSTDIPNSGEITISDVALNIGGRTVSIAPQIDPDNTGYVYISIQNDYSDDDTLKTIGYYDVPFTDMSITFTVSGFNYDNPDATGEAEEAVDETADTVGTDAAPAVEEEAETTAEAASGTSPVVVVVIIVVIVAVIAGVVVVTKKKKTETK